MSELLDRVQAANEAHALFTRGARVVVGVSGGPDSLALLHVLHEIACCRLIVATLDHGIRPEGRSDAAFVRETAQRWGLPVIVGRADVPRLARQGRLGLEEAARQVRYSFLLRAARMAHASIVAVGHNQDDQAETVLMHLIRGSGLSGLRGMLPKAPLNDYHLLPRPLAEAIELETFEVGPPDESGAVAPDKRASLLLVRPLLAVPRSLIEAYVEQHDLQPRHDASNTDQTFFRNRLRHAVLPLLAELNPNIRATLARTADVLRADADWLAQVGEAVVSAVVRVERPGGVVLDLGVWRELSLAEKRHVLRSLVFRLRPDLRDVTLENVTTALAVADRAEPETAATLPGGLLLRVGRGVLTLGDRSAEVFAIEPGQDAPALPPGYRGSVSLPGQSTQQRFGAWVFLLEPLNPVVSPDAVSPDAVSPDRVSSLDFDDPLQTVLRVPVDAWLTLRAWQPGDRFAPRGLGGTQKLVETLAGMRVAAEWRRRVPVLAVDDAPAWFVAPTPGGLRSRVAESFAYSGSGVELGEFVLVRAQWRALAADIAASRL